MADIPLSVMRAVSARVFGSTARMAVPLAGVVTGGFSCVPVMLAVRVVTAICPRICPPGNETLCTLAYKLPLARAARKSVLRIVPEATTQMPLPALDSLSGSITGPLLPALPK